MTEWPWTEWSARQDRLAARAVAYGAAHSAEIGGRLKRAGVVPADVRRVADLARIPLLPKDDLPALQAADPPFGGMLTVPVASLRRIYRSPGPIHDPEGDREDFWRLAPAVRAAGFRPGDVVLNTFSYHLTPGGLMLDAGFRAAGCTVVPGGVGNTAAQIELAIATGATGYAGTPQFLLTLLERARELGAQSATDAPATRGDSERRHPDRNRTSPLPFRRALVTGAPLPPPLRARLQDEFGVDVHQSYGTADCGTLGYECRVQDGWHVAPEIVIELLRPGDNRPAAAGDAGQVVVTSPNEVYPLVRFGTGDLSAWKREPCACGREGPRLAGFLGRVGEGVKVKGMFVHPRELAAALGGDPVVGRYQGVVREDAAGRDRLAVRIEVGAGWGGGEGEAIPGAAEVARLEARIREAVKVRAEVEVVSAGTISGDAPALVDERR